MSSNLVAYHGQCTDGFTAAWCAWKKLNGHAEYVPIAYGTPFPDCNGKHVYMLDYCPHEESVIRRVASEALSLTIIDHHGDKKSMLDAFDQEGIPGLSVVFDEKHSGAWLAYRHFCPTEMIPAIVQYVEDQDLDRWRLPLSKQYNAALQSFAFDFGEWDLAAYTPFNQMASDGAVILRYKERLVERAVAQAVEVEIDGYKVLAANTPLLMPEVATALAKDRPFGVAWMIRGDGLAQASLRSSGEVDVSKVARKFNGGGHVRCAGYEWEWTAWPHGLPSSKSA